MTGWLRRHGVLLLYALLALAAYPTTEYAAAGTRALVYALDVFDDGSVARLGALAPTWREHGLALWNPLLTAGNAWFSQFALPPIAPDTLLTLVLTPFQAFFVVQLALPAAAGVAMHVFVRRSLRLPVTSATVGGIVYALSLWHYPIGLAGPALPLLLTLVDRPPRPWPAGVAALAAILVVVLHQGLLQVVLLAGVLQLAWIVFATAPRRRRDALVTWFGAWLIAVLVSAPMLWSLAVALPESHRAVWDIAPELPLEVAVRTVAHRWASMLLAVPLPGGWGLHAPYEGTWFAGAIALPLVAVGAVRSLGSAAPHRFITALLLSLPLLDLVLLLAGPAIEETGPFGSFQLDRLRHFVPFAVAALAAIGFVSLRGVRDAGRWRWAMRTALGGAIVAVGAGVPAVLDRLEAVGQIGDVLAPPWIRVAWLVATAAGVGAVAIITWRPGSRAIVGTAVVATILLLGVERATYPRLERAVTPNGTSSWSARLGSSPIIDRVAEETRRDHSRAVVTGLYPNQLLFHRIPSVTGYENVYPLRVHQLLDVLFAPYLDEHPEDAAYYRRWGNRAVAFEPVWAGQIVDLLGARWIVTDAPVDDPDLTPVLTDGSRRLYRNDAALTRAFVVTAARVFEDREALFQALASTDTQELARTAYVEAEVPHGDGSPGTARFLVDAPDRLEVRVSSPDDGLLVVADAFMPGWRATVNGAAVDVIPVDGALRGVPVAAGESTVVMVYAPGHMPAAVVAAAIGAALMVALAAVAAIRRRTR